MKKLLSLLLSAVLAVSMSVPAAAFAADGRPTLAAQSAIATMSQADWGVNLGSEGYQSGINPYTRLELNGTPDNGYKGQCTWYAWGRAYEKSGGKVQLPFTGDARNWTALAADTGQYQTGIEPRADSIMVEDYLPEGHVFYVEKVEDGKAYVTEANWNYMWHDDVIDLTAMERRDNPGVKMHPLSYIYLQRENPVQVSSEPKSVASADVSGRAVTVAPLSVSGAPGPVTCSKLSGDGCLAVSPDGKVSVAKGAKSGTYSAVVRVDAAATDEYRAKTVDEAVSVSVVDAPAKPKVGKATSLVKGIKLSWSKVAGATGYEVQYSQSASFKIKPKSISVDASKGSASITGLGAKKVYYARVVAVKSSNGLVLKSPWSASRFTVTSPAPTHYLVSFSGNGGKGVMAPQTVKRDKSVALPANRFTRPGYTFAGWNTAKDGSGKTYKNKQKIKNLVSANKTSVTLYAQWDLVPYVRSTYKYDSATSSSYSIATVGNKTFKATAYLSNGVYKYKLTVTQGGKTKRTISGIHPSFLTNGKYLFYSAVGSAIASAAPMYACNHTLYRMDLDTGKKTKIHSGVNWHAFNCDGKYLYCGRSFSEAAGYSSSMLYVYNLGTKKLKYVGEYVGSGVTLYKNRAFTTHDTMNVPYPALYSLNRDGSGLATIDEDVYDFGFDGSKVVYVLFHNTGSPDWRNQYKLMRCSLDGTNKEDLSDWTTEYKSLEARFPNAGWVYG